MRPAARSAALARTPARRVVPTQSEKRLSEGSAGAGSGISSTSPQPADDDLDPQNHQQPEEEASNGLVGVADEYPGSQEGPEKGSQDHQRHRARLDQPAGKVDARPGQG